MSFWRKYRSATAERRRLSKVPRDLDPHLMRDIGLEPWPRDLRSLSHLLPRW